ncbi:L-methionine/branched-chain amino acid exporter YjeH [Sporomusa silvacetica DSM 10669]|uniref:L-methionine/branched-chain amino acid exporter YjeH n=1 Tax=Sporomusa silvacetica DSM 10669 TaxID=1123289 RepID=A0ABZ3INZ4_9FIRM|nr:amino acid permease [Sporomusa silvacetica]OZC19817.1 inner membrane protein YjeH [Sporomusa silvacetica DSM 10669]
MNQKPTTLRRSITWVQGVALTIGAVLGSGVLVLPVFAADLAGPASMISWVLMGLLTIPLVITLGKLASKCPDAGGIAAYAQLAFGWRAGTVTGWLFLGTVPIAAPIAALIGANYIGVYLALSHGQIVFTAAFTLAMTLFFNYRGISLSGKVQLAIVSVIALILLAVIAAALPAVDRQQFTPFAPRGWIPVGEAMTLLFWAFVGWEMIGHLAEEFEDPARDIQLSLGVSVIIVNSLYLLLALTIIGTGSYLGQDKVAALAIMVSQGWGKSAGAVVAALGFAVCYGAIHTYVAGFSRLVYAQARQGAFPAFFSGLHPVFQTPHRVLWSLVPCFSFVLFVIHHFNVNLAAFIQFPSAIFIALYIIGMASAIKLLGKSENSRYCAIISFISCVIVYGFTGWAGLYPIILGTVGWYMGYRKEASLPRAVE